MTPTDLKQWRLHHHLSQPTLAELLDVDPMTISRWERGTRTIPSFLALAIRGIECVNHGRALRTYKAQTK